MKERRTNALERIERKMEDMDADSIRYAVLNAVRSFKTSWMDLGQALYTVWKDKLYRDWGYGTFEAYTSREIGIRKQTAIKLLRSYYFLEKEEPSYLRKSFAEDAEPSRLPTYESVNVLRLANNKKGLDRASYAEMRQNVLDKGRDPVAAKKDLTAMIKQREELEPEEAWEKKRVTLIKRFLSALRSINREAKLSKVFPAQLVADTEKLINKLESQLS
jgi:hypothetical protein